MQQQELMETGDDTAVLSRLGYCDADGLRILCLDDVSELHFSEAAGDDRGRGVRGGVEHQHFAENALRDVGIGVRL